MKEYDEGYRTVAASCWREAKGDTKAATTDFVSRITNLGLKAPGAPTNFVRRWGQYWDEHGHCKGEASNSGRSRRLDPEDAEQLAGDLVNYQQFGLQGPFTSLRQLQNTSDEARDILEAAAASHSTVTRALREVAPDLVYKQLTVKQKLSPAQKKARLNTALQHQHVSDSTLERVVWIDAKTMYCSIRQRFGWVLSSEEVPFETIRPASRKKPITLKYYIGVNARGGAVFIRFVTGTTGYTPVRAYRVSLLLDQPMCSFPSLLATVR